MFWALGNVCSVPVIKCIGMGMGLLIWGAANMLTGWCMGYFGLFGVNADPKPHYPMLNIIGVLTALTGMCIFFFVQPEQEEKKGMKRSGSQIFRQTNATESPFVSQAQRRINTVKAPIEHYKVETEYTEKESSWVDHLTAQQRQTLGITLSLISGFFYGINFSPPTHLQQLS